ncbi:MAG: PilZ domain-containing protein, partial [Myxococcota bacterium]
MLVHDGELADVSTLLSGMGMPFCERQGAPTLDNMGTSWDLIIATARRILDLADTRILRARVWIAILDNDSRTLRAMVQRAGIDLVVRRPVHPMALRLLILHSLYRGPEKRRTDRVSVGFPVHYRKGLRRRPATMLELSMTGCRIIAKHQLPMRAKIALRIPRELTGARPLTLTGEIVRVRTMNAGNDRCFDLAISFRHLRPEAQAQLGAAIQRHADGPAVLRETIRDRGVRIPPPVSKEEKPPEGVRLVDCETPAAPGDPVLGPASPQETTGAETATTRPDDGPQPPAAPVPTERDAKAGAEHTERAGQPGGEPEPADEPERRTSGRWALQRHLIAMAEEATRVLLCRDISLGGMRIDPHPLLAVGDDLVIAVHLRAREKPLMVRGRVDRDDGDRGLML